MEMIEDKKFSVEGKPPEGDIPESIGPKKPLHLDSGSSIKNKELEVLRLKEQKLELLVEKRERMNGLPHRYGLKFYPWQREFFECFDKDLFLTAANQVGKSTILASTIIEWVGNKNLWPRLWGKKVPRQNWYLYPSADFATTEFETKWEPDILPRGPMKSDHEFGWEAIYKGPHIHSIKFNSGATIFFKSYTQDIKNLQGATVASIFCDEELPAEFWDELNFRRMVMGGYFRMGFTATLGQKLWFDVMERQNEKGEVFPEAKKMQISLYDCMEYEDGSPSHITQEYINRAISLCKSEAEVKKRVYGRFAVESGLKYAAFDQKKNIISPIDIPDSWWLYVGVDIGSGDSIGEEKERETSHPSAIIITAVSPEYNEVYVIDGWVGIKQLTTNMEVYEKLLPMLAAHGMDRVADIFYDYHAKDFGTICIRNGLSVKRADKSHDLGESVLNVLFKGEALKIFDLPQLNELVFELSNLKRDTPKRSARDDAADALRYALSRVPFDWTKLGINLSQPRTSLVKPMTAIEREMKERRSGLFKNQEEERVTVEEELEILGEQFDNDF